MTEQATTTSAAPTADIMSFFPLPSPRKSQEIVIREIGKVFSSGKRIILLEAPVGSGKSAIAMTVSGWLGSTHILTPRKSLQDQYHDDFEDRLVTMKGRNAYPCTLNATARRYNAVISSVEKGRSVIPIRGEEDSCAEGPCKGNRDVYTLCTSERPCPYTRAVEVASGSPAIVHNVHSFIFQTSFGGKFEKRPGVIVDEAHDLEAALREFSTKKITLNKVFNQTDLPPSTPEDWSNFLMDDSLVPSPPPPPASPGPGVTTSTAPWDDAPTPPTNSQEAPAQSAQGSTQPLTRQEEYLKQVENLVSALGGMGKFIVKMIPVENRYTRTRTGTSFEFIPESIKGVADRLILSYGEKALLMSGTIYDKDAFCRNAGLDPSEVHFIRVPSSFPAENRPIYCKPAYQVDTSHSQWDDNFESMIAVISKIMGIFHNVKGLIHAPSYLAAESMVRALNNPRVVTHDKTDLISSLEAFYESKEPRVFVSPVCQQGVDFKGDRARFQIITRVPYSNTSDEFVAHKVESDFSWYNYQALVVFGQQAGRVNRSEDDFGATFLLDSRFNKFLSKNSKRLPRWLMDAIIYK